MTRFTRTATGKYMVSGHSYEMLIGTRAQVWHGTAYKTSGGLCKSDLLQNKAGRIVSKSKHSTAKRERRLVKAGYGTKKGKFGFVKIGKRGGGEYMSSKKRGGQSAYRGSAAYKRYSMKMAAAGSRRRRRQRGGMMSPLSPMAYDGRGVGTSGVALQFIAGNGN